MISREFVAAPLGIIATILVLASLYYVYKSSKLMSGQLSSAFTKIGIGVLLIIADITAMGWTYDYFRIVPSFLISVCFAGLGAISGLFLFLGFKELNNVLAEVKNRVR